MTGAGEFVWLALRTVSFLEYEQHQRQEVGKERGEKGDAEFVSLCYVLYSTHTLSLNECASAYE